MINQVKSKKAVALLDPGMLATDVAHYLVRRGVPFRRAHHIVGSTLRRAATLGVTLQDMPHEEYVAIWYLVSICSSIYFFNNSI